MDRFVFLTFDGLSRGAVYAAFALALVLIWRAARIVNFAQGAMAVATRTSAYSVTGRDRLVLARASWPRSSAGCCSARSSSAAVMRFVDHTRRSTR